MRTLTTILATATTASAALAQVPPLPSPRPLLDQFGQSYDAAGYATAILGDMVLVGSRGADVGALNAGKVCAYHRSGGRWTQSASIVEPVPVARAEFGRSVTLLAGHAIVGAASADGSGRIVAVTRSGTGFGGQSELVSPNRTSGDRFAERVASSGSWLAVAAPGRGGVGAVDLFRLADGTWAFAATLAPPPSVAGSGFGSSVAVFGNTLAVGMSGDATLGEGAGAVVAYELAAGSWSATGVLRAPDGAAGDLFGSSVACNGEVLAAGAYRDDGGVIDCGSAYVFRRIGASWQYAQKLFPENSVGTADFGYSVAASSGRIIVGAPSAVIEGSRRGAAYVYEDRGGFFVPVLRIGAPGEGAVAFAGTSVAAGGPDVIVGAPLDTSAGAYSGGAGIVDLAADCDADGQPDAIELATGQVDADADGVPDACQCAGDFNGDGFANGLDLGILLGAWGTSSPFYPRADMDGSGTVDGFDLGQMLFNWGPCGG